MILVAGGDSFIFGNELNDQIGSRPSQNSFTALLAKRLGLSYHCAAFPGNANSAISRMMISECHTLKNQDIVAVVMWTFPHRFEFRFNYETPQVEISPWYSINAWNINDDISRDFVNKNNDILDSHLREQDLVKQSGMRDFAESFYRHVGNSEYYELYTTLKEILFLQNYFLQHKIPYIFCSADSNIQSNEIYHRRKDSCIDSIYNSIDWLSWFSFDQQSSKGFYPWACDNKYSIGTTHPLEQAHIEAANLIEERFNALVKNYNRKDQI